MSVIQIGEERRETPEIGLSDVSQMLRRRLPYMALIFLPLFLLGALITFQQKPFYEARASLVLDARERSILDTSEVLANPTLSSSFVETEIAIMKSRDLVGQVVDSLNLVDDDVFRPTPSIRSKIISLFKTPEPQDLSEEQKRKNTIDRVKQNLTIRRQGLGFTIILTFRALDPGLAQAVSNELAQVYIDEQLELRYSATKSASDWLSEQIKVVGLQLETAETELEDFRRSRGLLQMTTGPSLTEAQTAELSSELTQAQTQLQQSNSELEAARDTFKKGGGHEATYGLESPLLRELKMQLTLLEARRAEAKTRLGRLHPTVVELDEQIVTLRAQEYREIEVAIREKETAVTLLRQRVSNLRSRLDESQRQFANQSAYGVTLRQKQSEINGLRSMYQSLIERFQETSALESLGFTRARVVSKAVRPDDPAGPSMPLGLVLSAVGSGLIALGFGLLRHVLDRRIYQVSNLEAHLGMPVTGYFPFSKSARAEGKSSIIPSGHGLEYDSLSFLEMKLRRLLEKNTHSLKSPGRVILVTSPMPEDGKTFVSRSLASMLAQRYNRVLYIDSDLRKPGSAEEQKTDTKTKRLANITEAGWSFSKQDDGVYVGRIDRDVSSLFEVDAADKLEGIFTHLRRSFERIVVDTPPTLAFDDASIFANYADLNLLVLRWNRTTYEAAAQTIAVAHENAMDIDAILLNAVPSSQIPSQRYGRDYYYQAMKKKEKVAT